MKSTRERIVDTALYAFAIIPSVLLTLIKPTCVPYAGSYTDCALGSIGDSIASFLDVYGLIVALFGGWIIILLLWGFSFYWKIKKHGNAQLSTKELLLSTPFIFIYTIFLLPRLL